jgi:hypothetical protein
LAFFDCNWTVTGQVAASFLILFNCISKQQRRKRLLSAYRSPTNRNL